MFVYSLSFGFGSSNLTDNLLFRRDRLKAKLVDFLYVHIGLARLPLWQLLEPDGRMKVVESFQ